MTETKSPRWAPPPRRPWWRHPLLIGAAAVWVAAIVGGVGYVASVTPPPAPARADTQAPAVASTTTAPPAAAPWTPTRDPKPAATVSVGQRNALESARSYLSWGAFSRSGLVRQLEFEGYEPPDVEWAVSQLGTDWRAEAVESARSYLSWGSFSRVELQRQLESEGFTPEEAEHAVGVTYR